MIIFDPDPPQILKAGERAISRRLQGNSSYVSEGWKAVAKSVS